MMRYKYDRDSVIRQARERRLEALKMRKKGKTTREIAEEWGISIQRVNVILRQARFEK